MFHGTLCICFDSIEYILVLLWPSHSVQLHAYRECVWHEYNDDIIVLLHTHYTPKQADICIHTRGAHITHTLLSLIFLCVDNMQREGNNESNVYSINYCRILLALQLEAVLNRVTSETTNCGHTIQFFVHESDCTSFTIVVCWLNHSWWIRLCPDYHNNIMTDSEKVQDQQQQLKQKLQNHSDGVNGESTPDSVIQPKQTVGEYGIHNQKIR